MIRDIFLSLVCSMSCISVCEAQTLLPLSGNNISFTPTGAVDLQFTDDNQAFLLSELINWNEYDSYKVYFRKPTPATLYLGKDTIPAGFRSFQGNLPDCKSFHWEASNGQKFSNEVAWLMLKADTKTELSISEVILNRKDGKIERTNYPLTPFLSKLIHFEANNGEEFEQLLEVKRNIPENVQLYSGRVVLRNADSSIGGSSWSNDGEGRYILTLYEPIENDGFSWKYETSNGEVGFQKIEKGTTESVLSTMEKIKSCYIVAHNVNSSLNIKSVSIQGGQLPTFETLVLWHADGRTTDISLHTHPRVTFTTGNMLVHGTGIDFEFAAGDIVRFTYKKEDSDKIIDVSWQDDNVSFMRSDENIKICGITSANDVALYQLNGQRISVQITNTGKHFVLPLHFIPKGVNLLQIKDKTYKIIKK